MSGAPLVFHRPLHDLPGEEILATGHLGCPGCGIMPAVRLALRVLGKRTIIAAPACCFAVIDGPFPHSAVGVPLYHCAFETAAITAAGIRAGLHAQGIDDITVVAWAGDGGTFDIGMSALSGAAERNDDILYVCYDNEAYMNTGIQRSSATPEGAWTTTTPSRAGKAGAKKDLALIMAGHRIPYFATASIAWPEDFMRKVAEAKRTRGFRMIHYLSPCPTGWKMEERLMVAISRLAVDTHLFPLFEVRDGRSWRITMRGNGTPVSEYLKIQGRYRNLSEEAQAAIQAEADEAFRRLERREAEGI